MKNIYKALAEFQQECPAIFKGTEGFGYSYADLPTIYEVIMPLLKRHGLGFTQLLQGEGIETVLFHIESGEEIRSMTSIPQNVSLAKMNSYQVMGSAYTYYRRYALSSMLGLITEKDTDAQDTVLAPLTRSQPQNTTYPYPNSVNISKSNDRCSDCGANKVKNPKTGKIFCEKKCWITKGQTALQQQSAPIPTISYDEPPIDEQIPF